jgi:hypothetical protein
MPDELTDAQRKHLEFIQAVIARLSTDSFLMKGWALTLAGGLYGFAANHLNPRLAAVGLLPVLAFWFLDAYFLRQERLFRCLYEDARRPGNGVSAFSMDTSAYRHDDLVAWPSVIFSLTLRVFYGTLLVAGLVLVLAGILS